MYLFSCTLSHSFCHFVNTSLSLCYIFLTLSLSLSWHLVSPLAKPNQLSLPSPFLVGGPGGCICFASCGSAGAPAGGAAVARRHPLSVCERGRCGAAAAGHCLAALPQCPPSCAVQGRPLISGHNRTQYHKYLCHLLWVCLTTDLFLMQHCCANKLQYSWNTLERSNLKGNPQFYITGEVMLPM